jgi:hypothetical protein
MAEHVISYSALPGDHHLAAGPPPHFKLSKNTANNLAIHPPQYHVLQKTVIRPTNKKVPHSPKTSNHTTRYQSPANKNSHPPKCINSINFFDKTALSPAEIFEAARPWLFPIAQGVALSAASINPSGQLRLAGR